MNGNPTTTGGFAGPTGKAGSPTYFSITNPNGTRFSRRLPREPSTCRPGVRDSVYGPGFQNWNIALFKKFAINERTDFQFRAEAYDFINHPNWSAPNFTATSPSSVRSPGD